MESELPLGEKPTSVTVLGVLNVVFGGLTLLCGMCGAVSLVMPLFLDRGPMYDIYGHHPWGRMMAVQAGVSQLLGFALAVALIIAGVGLLQGRSWGRKLSIGVAIAWLGKFVVGQAGAAVMWLNRSARESMFEGMELGRLGEVPVVLIVFVLAIMAVAMVFQAGYPVVLLVFMYLKSVRAYFARLRARGESGGGTTAGEEGERG